MENKVKEFVRDYYRYSINEDDCIERYVDYRDEFPKSDINKILNSSNPQEIYDEIITDWNINADDWYYENDFWRKFNTFCKENSFDKDEARQIVYDNFYWDYPDYFLNPTVDTVLTIDVGDGNYDFSCHNILNYARDKDCKSLDEKSGLYWLAKQQRRLTLLNKCIAKSDCYSDGDCDESPFVESCITELVNASSSLTHLSFLVKMPLSDAIRIEEYRLYLLENKRYNEFYPQDCKENFGYIVLSKETVCGLYDSWHGGGSVLGIELEKDVKIPIHFIESIVDTKELQSVYGLTSECWQETVKQIEFMEIA